MDDSFRRVYAEIYSYRTRSALEERSGRLDNLLRGPRLEGGSLAAVVAEAIEDAARRLPPPLRLREDAKALLAVNFEDLVVVPLVIGGGMPPTELRDDVTVDISMLVQE